MRREAGHVRLYLAYQQYETEKTGKHGKVVYGKSVRAVQTVKLAHPTKIVLDRDADGTPHLCLEVKVKRLARSVAEAGVLPCPLAAPCCPEGRACEVIPGNDRVGPAYIRTTPPCCTEGLACMPHPSCEHCPAPSCCHEANGAQSQDEEIAAFWNTLAEMICGNCPLMQSSWAETAVPSGHYFSIPATQVFPLARELAYQEKVATACTPDSGIHTCAAWKSGSASSQVRVVEREGKQCLEIVGGAARCCSENIIMTAPDSSPHGDPLRLTVEAGQVCLRLPHMTATADRLMTGPDCHIVLKGNVRMEKTSENARCVIVGDRIDINLSNGSTRINGTGAED
jgi:hypothetical protein